MAPIAAGNARCHFLFLQIFFIFLRLRANAGCFWHARETCCCTILTCPRANRRTGCKRQLHVCHDFARRWRLHIFGVVCHWTTSTLRRPAKVFRATQELQAARSCGVSKGSKFTLLVNWTETEAMARWPHFVFLLNNVSGNSCSFY